MWLAAAADNSGVIIAAIGAGATVLVGLGGVVLNRVFALTKKTDVVDAKTSSLQVQFNGQMTKILDQLEAANARAIAAEVKLARMEARHPDDAT